MSEEMKKKILSGEDLGNEDYEEPGITDGEATQVAGGTGVIVAMPSVQVVVVADPVAMPNVVTNPNVVAQPVVNPNVNTSVVASPIVMSPGEQG